jgi:hypothetical protein
VRTIEVHGACLQGAVPSANASRVETKVTEAALNPAGTGPPGGWLMLAGTVTGGEADAGWEADGDAAAERATDGASGVPHAAASATISSPPHADANDVFIELTS